MAEADWNLIAKLGRKDGSAGLGCRGQSLSRAAFADPKLLRVARPGAEYRSPRLFMSSPSLGGSLLRQFESFSTSPIVPELPAPDLM
eukprot:762639-Hanusia_phi.AAC.11